MPGHADFLALGLDDGGERATGISAPEVTWILEAAPHFRIRTSVETGFGLGFSAAALLLAGVQAHTAIEIEEWRLSRAEANARKALGPHQHLRVLRGSSHVRLAQLQARGERFDLMLVDGGHRFDDVFVDVHYGKALVRPGGLMVLDDAPMSAVRSVRSWIDTNLAHVWREHVPPQRFRKDYDFGFAVYLRTDDPDGDGKLDGSRPWDRHRRFETYDNEN